MRVVVVAGAAFVALLLLVAVVRAGRRADVTPAGEWRLVAACRVLGLLAGGGAVLAVVDARALLWASEADLGRGAVLAPAVFGLVVLLAAILGETAVRPRRPAGPRRASLRPRRVTDYLPRVTARLVVALAVGLVGTLVSTVATASPDDQGRAGRALTCAVGDVSQSRSPYPGSFYAVPLSVVLLVVVVVAAWAARRVVVRPRGLAATEDGDDELRRRSVTVVTAATGVAFGATLAGVAFGAGLALTGLDVCGGGWTDAAGALLLLLAAAAALAACWCLARLVVSDPLR